MDRLFDGLLPWFTTNLQVLIPPMFLITAAIQVFRDGWQRIAGGELPVEGSPKDHLRNALLFTLPFIFGIIYMMAASGWWAPRYHAKQIILGGIGLGIINTVLYRYAFKPYLFAWVKNWMAKKAAPEQKP